MTIKQQLQFFPKTCLRILLRTGPADALRFLKDYRKICKEIKSSIADIIDAFRVDDPGLAYQKYLDVDVWVYESLRRAFHLGLQRPGPRKRILDLGTGAGYFPYICRYYGHIPEALDIPDNEMYNQIIVRLGIKRYSQYIQKFESLHIKSRYDLVTAFMICFNNHKTPEVWHIEEWDFFLSHLSKENIDPGGTIFLLFNAESEEEPVNPDLLQFLRRRGGHIQGREVSINRDQYLATRTVAISA
jgi:hypothetical protein